MKRHILAFALIIALLAATNIRPTQAAGYSATYTVTGTGTCSSTSLSLPITFAFNFPPVSGIGHLTESINGKTIYGLGPYSLLTGNVGPFSSTLTSDAPYNQSGDYTFIWDVQFADSTGVIFSHNWFVVSCHAGVATGAAFNLVGSGMLTFNGPAIPSGFVLRTITCTVAIFDTPAGRPVGDNKFLAGQTWFVNPLSVKGKDGKQWTEVFDGGFIDGYIPTFCVGVRPPNYFGN